MYLPTPEYDKLMCCIGSLFYKPPFCRLGLYDFELLHSSGEHIRCFNEIILSFLCSPITGQELEFSFLPCIMQLGDIYVDHSKQPSNAARGSKSLIIVQDNTPDPTDVPWFTTFFSSPLYPLWTLGYLYLSFPGAISAETLAIISALEWRN